MLFKNGIKPNSTYISDTITITLSQCYFRQGSENLREERKKLSQKGWEKNAPTYDKNCVKEIPLQSFTLSQKEDANAVSQQFPKK